MTTGNAETGGFVHRFAPGTAGEGTTLLLLHGTGGDEDDLLGLGRAVAPGAALLSPRGRVLENGMPRFFRRLAEGVFDEADLVARTHELADFVTASAARHGFDPGRVVALGYSNGANIAAATLLLRPEVLAGAVLLRPTLPLEPPGPPDLRGRRVLAMSGRRDPFAPAARRDRLAQLLRSGGAEVEVREDAAGHGLEPHELPTVAGWLAALRGRGAAAA
jgi:predicted esterase